MLGKGLPLFKLFGIQVKLDASWFIIAILIAWSLAEQFFPYLITELADEKQAGAVSTGTYWVMGIAGALGLFASILAHEFGHALVAQRRGMPMRGITLFLFGGVAEMGREPDSAKDEFLVAIAGPIVSVVIGVAGLAAASVPMPDTALAVVYYLGFINLLVVAFNMIPAFPLDGGRVLRSALWAWKGDLRWASRIASRFGSAFGVLLIVLAVLRLFAGDFVGAMWYFILGLFLRGAAQQSYQQVLVRESLGDQPVRRFMNDQPRSVPVDATLEQFVNDYVYRHHFKMFPVVRDGELAGCIDVRQLRDVPRDDWAQRGVGELAGGCDAQNTIDAGTPASDALQRMAQSQRSRLIVVDDGKLAGVIALKDLIRHIELKREIEG